MDYHDRFLRVAGELGVPQDEAARFAGLIRFRIRAGREPGGVRVGRFGGLPPLSEQVPLTFMASLDCAALPRVAGFVLPEAGTLLFYLLAAAAVEACSIADEQRFARIVHVPARPVAGGGPGVDLFARVEADLPNWLDGPESRRSEFQKHVTRDMPHGAELVALVDRLWPGRQPWIGEDFVLGGYSVSAQDSPETRLAEQASGGSEPYLPPGPERLYRMEEKEFRVMGDWVPLAQFSVPCQAYIKGRFLIRHDDLAAGHFDKALSFCEFTE
ncbi:DUF1963 domain-containing protein [Actinoplanes regularis]|uniref:DUF1963 domain-containing protein n=1 Tax=Actinoplanes regularis TaxID=52697 RepID=UPI0025535CE7|nr:DUF1963 domain-containing protein [Actinoplanes regularis]